VSFGQWVNTAELISEDLAVADKNGQNTLKTAFMADQQIIPRGFKSLEANRQHIDNKSLTTSTNPVLATGLDNLAQIYPDCCYSASVGTFFTMFDK
jgi:hypothetical protein